MLKATAMQVRLSASDLEGALAAFTAGRVDSPAVSLDEGAVTVKVKVTAELLPFPVPVELRFTVASVDGTRLELGVTWSNLPLLPGQLKELALKKAFEALPGTYDKGRFCLDVAELLDHVPVNFRIEEIELNRHGVWVSLTDVAIYPLDVGGLAGIGPVALVPVPSVSEAKIPEHQSYYHKLRERMARLVAEKAPRWMQPLVPWVLAAPDFFVLLVRLARDERVPTAAKVMAGVAVAYFISPMDVIPDLLPLVGHVDDLALALFAVEQIARRVPPELVQEHWPGDDKVAELVTQGSALFHKALPAKVLILLRKLLRSKRSN